MATLSSGPAHSHPAAGGLNAGSRSIARYLDEVIFAPLPAEVLDFLLQTSVLNRLHPALCDAVTGKTNGEAMLAWIAQRNLFLSALDEGGLWFRYHPLMRDALLSRLQRGGGGYSPAARTRRRLVCRAAAVGGGDPPRSCRR